LNRGLITLKINTPTGKDEEKPNKPLYAPANALKKKVGRTSLERTKINS